jgi:phosphatidate cytidylyltransferase
MLKTRILTAIVLTVIFVFSLFLLATPYWHLFALSIVTLAAWEWAILVKYNQNQKIAYVLSILLLGLLLFLGYPQYIELVILVGILLGTIFWLVIAPWLLYTKKQITNKVANGLVGLLILIPFGLSLIELRTIGPTLPLVLIFAVAVADTGAYFAGVKFGRHKLAPNISPNKTWEGVLGALISVSLLGIGICFLTHQSWVNIIFLWILTLFAIEGDLLESLFKRQAGVKDSGTLLPGHGGVLDRIDALTSSLTVMTFMLFLPMLLALFLV